MMVSVVDRMWSVVVNAAAPQAQGGAQEGGKDEAEVVGNVEASAWAGAHGDEGAAAAAPGTDGGAVGESAEVASENGGPKAQLNCNSHDPAAILQILMNTAEVVGAPSPAGEAQAAEEKAGDAASGRKDSDKEMIKTPLNCNSNDPAALLQTLMDTTEVVGAPSPAGEAQAAEEQAGDAASGRKDDDKEMMKTPCTDRHPTPSQPDDFGMAASSQASKAPGLGQGGVDSWLGSRKRNRIQTARFATACMVGQKYVESGGVTTIGDDDDDFEDEVPRAKKAAAPKQQSNGASEPLQAKRASERQEGWVLEMIPGGDALRLYEPGAKLRKIMSSWAAGGDGCPAFVLPCVVDVDCRHRDAFEAGCKHMWAAAHGDDMRYFTTKAKPAPDVLRPGSVVMRVTVDKVPVPNQPGKKGRHRVGWEVIDMARVAAEAHALREQPPAGRVPDGSLETVPSSALLRTDAGQHGGTCGGSAVGCSQGRAGGEDEDAILKDPDDDVILVVGTSQGSPQKPKARPGASKAAWGSLGARMAPQHQQRPFSLGVQPSEVPGSHGDAAVAESPSREERSQAVTQPLEQTHAPVFCQLGKRGRGRPKKDKWAPPPQVAEPAAEQGGLVITLDSDDDDTAAEANSAGVGDADGAGGPGGKTDALFEHFLWYITVGDLGGGQCVFQVFGTSDHDRQILAKMTLPFGSDNRCNFRSTYENGLCISLCESRGDTKVTYLMSPIGMTYDATLLQTGELVNVNMPPSDFANLSRSLAWIKAHTSDYRRAASPKMGAKLGKHNYLCTACGRPLTYPVMTLLNHHRQSHSHWRVPADTPELLTSQRPPPSPTGGDSPSPSPSRTPMSRSAPVAVSPLGLGLPGGSAQVEGLSGAGGCGDEVAAEEGISTSCRLSTSSSVQWDVQGVAGGEGSGAPNVSHMGAADAANRVAAAEGQHADEPEQT